MKTFSKGMAKYTLGAPALVYVVWTEIWWKVLVTQRTVDIKDKMRFWRGRG